MNKIKIIDLLNMISKGEEVPKKIKYDNQVFEYREDMLDYYCYDYDLNLMGYQQFLNDEVEIIEEKKIPEEIDLTGYWDKNSLRTEEWCSSEEILGVKINEILDYLESKEKGE